MVVLSDEECKICHKVCNAIHYQQNFENWTSGNNDIDKFIQDTQLSAHDSNDKPLEWIPYDRFYDIEYIAKGGFGKVYSRLMTLQLELLPTIVFVAIMLCWFTFAGIFLFRKKRPAAVALVS